MRLLHAVVSCKLEDRLRLLGIGWRWMVRIWMSDWVGCVTLPSFSWFLVVFLDWMLRSAGGCCLQGVD